MSSNANSPAAALEYVRARFPFPGYMGGRGAADEEYLMIARTVLKYLPVRSRLLDFGSGPADKTAVLQALGYQCAAYDDLMDDWHQLSDNRETIMRFARSSGIDFRLAGSDGIPFAKDSFDMVLLNAVIEHLHDSPRVLLNSLLALVRPGGFLFITVPNAVNIRKRFDVMRGRTNLPAYEHFYWSPGPWRGHVREYVKNDLVQLADYLGIEIKECRGCDCMLGKVPRFLLPAYLTVTAVFDSWKDSLMLVGKKPEGWVSQAVPSPERLQRIRAHGVPYAF